MTTYFISRHEGAINWIKAHGKIKIDLFISHLDNQEDFNSGDIVIGSLPIHLIFELQSRGVRYFNLSINIPEHKRGIELSVEDLLLLGVCLVEYAVKKV